MSIGYFGKEIIFETSSGKVLTFTNLKHSTSIVVEQHKIIGRKPLSEVCGQELDSVSFTINLNKGLGVNPKELIDKLNELSQSGEADVLVIGGKTIGIDKFLIKDVSAEYETVYNNGFLYAAKVDLTLEEYISDVSLNKGPTSTSSSGKTQQAYYSRPAVNADHAQTVSDSLSSNYNIDSSDPGVIPLLTNITEALLQ